MNKIVGTEKHITVTGDYSFEYVHKDMLYHFNVRTEEGNQHFMCRKEELFDYTIEYYK